ncbi:MAG: glycogen-binding domain-containing protein [Gemmatimonadaceae bacterium]
MVVRVALSQTLGSQTFGSLIGRGAIVGVDGGSVIVDDYVRASVGSVFSTLWSATDRFATTATGSVARFETGHLAAYGELHAAAQLGRSLPALITLEGDGGGGAYRGDASSGYVRTVVRVARGTNSGKGVWVAAGAGRAGGAALYGSYGTAHGAVGVSTQHDEFAGAATVDLVHAGVTYTDVTTRAVRSFGTGSGSARASVQLTGGIRAGNRVSGRHQWAEGSATVKLVRSSALLLARGTTPPDPERATPGVAFTSLGIQLAFGGPGTLSQSSGAQRRVGSTVPAISTSVLSDVSEDGRRTLTVHLSAFSGVELMGDFTQWRALPMTRVGENTWRTRVILQPGTHRVNIRADGGVWLPVPGLPETSDEFGGSASILVVP